MYWDNDTALATTEIDGAPGLLNQGRNGGTILPEDSVKPPSELALCEGDGSPVLWRPASASKEPFHEYIAIGVPNLA